MIYDADEELRISLARPLAQIELALRSSVAHVIAAEHGAYKTYLEQAFYTDSPGHEPTVESCRREIARSLDRHILRYRNANDNGPSFENLPV